MKILLVFLLIQSSYAQVVQPSSCPYLIKDQDSYDILKSTEPVLAQELQRIQQEMGNESSKCLLPPINEVAKSEMLIQSLAQQMVPAKNSFDALFLAGQKVSCTTTVTGFRDVIDSYKSYVLESFKTLPKDPSHLKSYLDLAGNDGEKINSIFYDCHREQVGVSTEMSTFSSCVDKGLYGTGPAEDSLVFHVWNSSCGQDLTEKSEMIQKILNQSESDANKRQTTEELISASYKQISATIDTLMNTDPSCRYSAQYANTANSLITASVGLGQQLGSPFAGLALNLVAKPISIMINSFAQKDLREKEKDLKELYDNINNVDKQRNEKFLCTMISMQKLKCDTIKDYAQINKAEECEDPTAESKTGAEINGLMNILHSIRTSPAVKTAPLKTTNITENNAGNYLSDLNIEQMSELSDKLFKSAPGLRQIGGEEDLSFQEYLFGKDSSPGIVDQLNIDSFPSMSDKIKLNREKIGLENLKSEFSSFREGMNKLTLGDFSPQNAASVLNSYKNIANLLSDKPENPPVASPLPVAAPPAQAPSTQSTPTGGQPSQAPVAQTNQGTSQTVNVGANTVKINIPFVLSKYYEQMGDGSDSDLYKYALKEMKTIANTTVEETKTVSVKGLAVADRFNNTENYFNFMSSYYSQDKIIDPMLSKIDKPKSMHDASPGEKEFHFDAKVLPALRDCLFLYQPVMMSESVRDDRKSRQMGKEYKNKCEFMLKCQTKLGFNLNPQNLANLNSSTNFDDYKPLCHIQKNFSFIFSKARVNYMNSGDVCVDDNVEPLKTKVLSKFDRFMRFIKLRK